MNHRITLRRAAVGATTGVALIGIAGASAPAHAATFPTVLAKIRYCESGNNYQAQNPTSSAAGAYQFLTSTWRSLSAAQGYATASQAPASVQDAAAIELYNQMGTSPWAASQSCWSALGAVPTTGSTSGSTTSSTSTQGAASGATSTSGTSTTTRSAGSGTSSSSRTDATARPKTKTGKKANDAPRQHTNRTDRDGDGRPDCERAHGADTAKHAAKKAANPAPAKAKTRA